MLREIFATYAIVLAPALVLLGRVSDRFGRRPVVAGGLLAARVGLALFAAWQGEGWLFAARSLDTAVEAGHGADRGRARRRGPARG